MLVHGACLGAWCWYKVETFLKLAGHHVSAIDLGASGVNSKRLDDEIASIPDYLQPLMEFMACLPQEKKVILVGHSYSGLCISLAMENFHEKISVAVFISAYMPHYKSPPAALIQEYFNRTPVESLLDCQFTFNKGLENPPTSALFGPEYMKTVLCKRCQLEDAGFGTDQNVGQTNGVFRGRFVQRISVDKRKVRVGGSSLCHLQRR